MIWKSPKTLANWRTQKNRIKSEEKLGAGYLSLIKGDWRRAESQLTAKAKHIEVPYVNYLAAAKAAQEQGRTTQRDEYLKKAYESAPNEKLAIGMTKAKLHQQAGQFEQALATLKDIEAEGRNNPQYTAMLLQSSEQINDWDQVKQLLPAARRQKALPDDLLIDMQNKIDVHSLQNADDMQNAWRSLDRKAKKESHNVALYASHLMQAGQNADAEKLIRSTLKNTWSDELVSLYGQIPADKPAKLLRRVEGWLLARGDNPHVLLAAGRLAMADKNLDVAKDYFQSAIIKGQLPEAYALLGEAYEASNESAKALGFYRKGMQALTHPEAAAMLEQDTEEDTVKEGELLAAEDKA